MGWVFLLVAAALFFLSAVGSAVIPNAGAWGLVALAIGLAIGQRGASMFQKS
jgi:hypothetical protein